MHDWRALPTKRADGRLARARLVVHPPVAGRGIPARELLVLLPPGYRNDDRPRPVCYLQDGQNLFDDAASFAGSWRAVDAIENLARGKSATSKALPVLVGIPNAGLRRLHEYSPFRDPRYGGGGARSYLSFVLREVKPRVEQAFRVATSGDGVIVGGASLGGLFALWAYFAAPGVFGGALAMSPTTLFAGEALLASLGRARFHPGRIYLDCGTEEGRRRRPGRARRTKSPTAYVRRVRRLRGALERLGYRRGEALSYVEDPGGVHQESSWSRRLPSALLSLL